jgi:PAS domain S-box-containing protein
LAGAEPESAPSPQDEVSRLSRFAIEKCVEPAFWANADSRFNYVNEAACRSLGYSREELLTMSIPDIDPDFPTEKWPDHWRQLKEQRAITLESRHRRKDGRIFSVEITANFIEFEGKEYNCAFARDISARKQAENFLAGQARVLEVMATGAPLEETLGALIRLIEENSGGALGSILLVAPDGKHLRHAAAPSLPESYSRAVDGVPVGPRSGSCGTAAHRRENVIVSDIEKDPLWDDYRDLALSRGLRACWSTPILSSTDKVLGTFAMYYPRPRSPRPEDLKRIETSTHLARIVIERKKSEEALRRAAERFRELIENMPDGVVVHRMGQIVYVNPTVLSVLGVESAEEVLGKSTLEFIAPEHQQMSIERVRTMYETGQPAPVQEIRIVRRDGSTLDTEMLALPLDFEGEPAILVMARDITERKQMQSRMLRADRMASVGTLAAGLAHEINNPLAYIISNLDFLVAECPRIRKARAPETDSHAHAAGGSPAEEDLAARMEEIEETLQETREGVERVRRIVGDLKTFSRDGGEPLGSVDVRRVLESSMNLAQSEIAGRARLVKDLQAVPLVEASESRLGQVFLNLLLNAAQALPDGRAEENTIRVATRTGDAGQAIIEIRDSGTGIAPEILDRIFEPFFTTKPAGIGTGLGLSICQNIVTAFGGEITVESEPGRHSLFRVSIPAISAV